MAAEADKLIPLFVPSLAEILAFSEKKKGAPLTVAEAEGIRDKGTCIMLRADEAEQMAEARGYIDVNPKNCWADWHRLRTQMTGNGYLPKLVLCIPGGADFRARCEPILTSRKVEHEFGMRDEKMTQAFRASSVTWPAFSAEDFAQIQGHATVLYVLSANFTAAAAPAVGREFMRLGRDLLEAGGIAIKCESSGISHPKSRWLKFVEMFDRGAAEQWSALYHALVVSPIGSKTDFYTCGMHLLGAPDLIVSQQVILSSAKDTTSATSTAIQLFRVFAMYLLGECPIGTFASGHTFSLDRDSPRYRVLWEPCAGYPEDNFFFNSFGRWRFSMP